MVLERCGGGVQAGLSVKNIISKEKLKIQFKTDNKIIYSLPTIHRILLKLIFFYTHFFKNIVRVLMYAP